MAVEYIWLLLLSLILIALLVHQVSTSWKTQIFVEFVNLKYPQKICNIDKAHLINHLFAWMLTFF